MVLQFCGLTQKPELKNRERGVVAWQEEHLFAPRQRDGKSGDQQKVRSSRFQ
jgi:hypothetical protein